jgi:lysophospholipase L1-like esterase
MKTILVLLFVMISMSFSYQKKTKIIFFGDSITNAGAWPASGTQPKGYILHIDSLCKQDRLGDKYEFIGAGAGGDKVYDLYLRMEKDVLEKKPDVVVIFIGINDVWHKSLYGTGTDPDKFVKFYKAILDKLKASKIKAVLCTPGAIGEKTDHSNYLDKELDSFSDSIRSVAAINQLPLVDFRKYFLEYNLKHNTGNNDSGILTYPGDGVHLSATGNLFVAQEMWKVLKALK